MSYEQKLGKFEVETRRFLPDSLCHYIKTDLELLENTSPEIIRNDINDIKEKVDDIKETDNIIKEDIDKINIITQ